MPAAGLETVVATGYRASTTTVGRLLAMGRASLHPGPLRSHLDAADVVHYPLTVPVPRVEGRWIRRSSTCSISTCRGSSRAASACSAGSPTTAPHDGRPQVVVISEWVRQRVVERLGLDPDRVHAIHLGVDHRRFTPAPDVVREDFLLYPARPWPHKNHARLVEAFALVRERRPGLRLVLTGVGHDPARLPPGVEALGGVSADELVSLYRRAAALVFPSLYEGFGLPPVEAMACGCPVAASSAGALPEVVGDAAVLFDPLDPEAIAAGIDEALDRANQLAGLGIARAARFTWDATARAHDRVYELAA